ncbi:MAG: hypothetical protein IJQ02_05325 [Oscillospiraceae bacterium]|nr:hypothetical protein [Oscillospiraceae bacterium]
MKKLFQNSRFALILTIVLVIFSTLLNTHIRLGRISDSVSDSFYASNSETPIAEGLRTLAGAAERLATLGEEYRPSEAEETKENVEMLRTLLRYESASPATLSYYYSSLLSNCFTLESVLVQTDLNESQEEMLSEAMHDAAEAKAAIDASSYNERVRTFTKRYDRFPTNLLAGLAGVSYPVLFT